MQTGDTPHTHLGAAVHTGRLELTHTLSWGRSDSYPARGLNTGPTVENEVELWEMEEVIFLTYLRLKRTTATLTPSL